MGTEPKLPDFGGKLVMAIFNRVLQSVEQYLQCGQQYMAALRKFGSAAPQSLFSRIIRASFR